MVVAIYRTMLGSSVAMLCAALVCGTAAPAEPLLTQGIGTSNCGRLAADLRPGEGLGNSVNLMAYSWAQGYISAANIALVESGSEHVDMSQLDDNRVLTMLQRYCKANPDRQPLGALNDFLRTTEKVHIKWDKGTVNWNP